MAYTAEDEVLAGSDSVHAAVLRRDGGPRFGAHRYEQLPYEVFELRRRELEQVGP
jgi:hypothetical protein